MTNDQFTKLFNHMNQRFDEVEAKLETKANRSQVDHIQQTLDGIANRLDRDDVERAAIIDKLDRHEHWIGQLARNTDTQLVPEP